MSCIRPINLWCISSWNKGPGMSLAVPTSIIKVLRSLSLKHCREERQWMELSLQGLGSQERSRGEALPELVSVWKITPQLAAARNSWEWKEQTAKHLIKAKILNCPADAFYRLNQQVSETQNLLRDLHWLLDCSQLLFPKSWPLMATLDPGRVLLEHFLNCLGPKRFCPISSTRLDPLPVATSSNQAWACLSDALIWIVSTV